VVDECVSLSRNTSPEVSLLKTTPTVLPRKPGRPDALQAPSRRSYHRAGEYTASPLSCSFSSQAPPRLRTTPPLPCSAVVLHDSS